MSSSSGSPAPDGPRSASSSRYARHGLSRRAFISGGAAVATWASLDSGSPRSAVASIRKRTRMSTAKGSFRIKVPKEQLVEEPELFSQEVRAAFRSLR